MATLFVEAELFHSAQHYGKLMGYDKPMDNWTSGSNMMGMKVEMAGVMQPKRK